MTTRPTTIRKSALLAIGVAAAFSVFSAERSAAGYRWAYHPEYGYRRVGIGYGGLYGGATTAAQGAGVGLGAAEAGLGREAEGIGQYQVEHAQAEQIHQQAVTQYYRNLGVARENYEEQQQFQEQQKEAADAAARQRVADYHEHLQQLTAAHRLTADQFDRQNNIIHWPYVLRGADYSDLRFKLDQLYSERTPDNSGTDSAGYDEIKQACDEMLGIIDSHAKDLGIDDFITAKHFAQSLEYEARFKMNGSGNGNADDSSGSN